MLYYFYFTAFILDIRLISTRKFENLYIGRVIKNAIAMGYEFYRVVKNRDTDLKLSNMYGGSPNGNSSGGLCRMEHM